MLIPPETIPFDPRVYGKGYVNSDDTSTPASVLTDIHYAKLGIQGAWDANRVIRMCGLLQLTRYELASLLLIPHCQMTKYMEREIFPGSICLLLSLIENQVISVDLMDKIPEGDTPLIPTQILFNGTTKAS